MQWFLDFEELLLSKWGYISVVHFEDIIEFFSGIFVGLLIMTVLCGRVVFRLEKVKNLGSNKVKLVKLKHEGYEHYIADPKSISEAIETLLIVIFRPLFQYKEYTYRDERRTKMLLIVVFMIGLLVLMIGILCVSTVVIDNVGLTT